MKGTMMGAVGVSDNTIRNMEACGHEPVGGFASTREKVREGLERLGILPFTQALVSSLAITSVARTLAAICSAAAPNGSPTCRCRNSLELKCYRRLKS
jgi:hypothetical protein